MDKTVNPATYIRVSSGFRPIAFSFLYLGGRLNVATFRSHTVQTPNPGNGIRYRAALVDILALNRPLSIIFFPRFSSVNPLVNHIFLILRGQVSINS